MVGDTNVSNAQAINFRTLTYIRRATRLAERRSATMPSANSKIVVGSGMDDTGDVTEKLVTLAKSKVVNGEEVIRNTPFCPSAVSTSNVGKDVPENDDEGPDSKRL
jgi:hypothetical protein